MLIENVNRSDESGGGMTTSQLVYNETKQNDFWKFMGMAVL